MVFKKRSKLEAMKILKEQVGEFSLSSLIKGEMFLLRDNNDQDPYQIILNLAGDQAYDSRRKFPVSYECFEEIKGSLPRIKMGFQNFYKLDSEYIKTYSNFLKSESKKSN